MFIAGTLVPQQDLPTAVDALVPVVVQVSTVLGAAIKEEREQSAWTEGVAIWVAVIVVSGVGKSTLTRLCHILRSF